tara:strand:+ start:1793 stop:1966 length:174 start_codon:yes stop_codon:yes gene_type:complete
MEIKNAKYEKDVISGTNSAINCQIGDRFCSVPINEENTDYQKIQEWVADGNTIEAAD